jgi:hypothetical protein
VLRTNTDLDPVAAMLYYKQLWTVEQTFHCQASVLDRTDLPQAPAAWIAVANQLLSNLH